MQNFLPYLIPSIVIAGWAIGIVQANKDKDGNVPLGMYKGLFVIYQTTFIIWSIVWIGQLSWLNTPSNIALAVFSIPYATYFYNKKDKLGTVLSAATSVAAIYNLVSN